MASGQSTDLPSHPQSCSGKLPSRNLLERFGHIHGLRNRRLFAEFVGYMVHLLAIEASCPLPVATGLVSSPIRSRTARGIGMQLPLRRRQLGLRQAAVPD